MLADKSDLLYGIGVCDGSIFGDTVGYEHTRPLGIVYRNMTNGASSPPFVRTCAPIVYSLDLVD